MESEDAVARKITLLYIAIHSGTIAQGLLDEEVDRLQKKL